MASARTSILLRTLARNASYTPRSITRSPLVPYVRLHRSLQPIPCVRANIRFYSTTPPDDIKVYTFKEIDSLSKGPKDKYIIDVREPGELQQEGKIPNAINLPLSSLQETLNLPDDAFHQKFDFKKPEKNKEVIFYCKAGVRSTNASAIAKEAGYTKIGNYKGSFDDWLASKGTVAKAA